MPTEPYSFKPSANRTVLGTWPRRSKWSQNILGPEHHCPPRSLSRSLDCVKELQSHPSLLHLLSPSHSGVPGVCRSGKAVSYVFRSNLMLIVVFDVELSLAEAGSTSGPLAAPLDHWQPGTFVSSHNHLCDRRGLWHEWHHLGIFHLPHTPKPSF